MGCKAIVCARSSWLRPFILIKKKKIQIVRELKRPEQFVCVPKRRKRGIKVRLLHIQVLCVETGRMKTRGKTTTAERDRENYKRKWHRNGCNLLLRIKDPSQYETNDSVTNRGTAGKKRIQNTAVFKVEWKMIKTQVMKVYSLRSLLNHWSASSPTLYCVWRNNI